MEILPQTIFLFSIIFLLLGSFVFIFAHIQGNIKLLKISHFILLIALYFLLMFIFVKFYWDLSDYLYP